MLYNISALHGDDKKQPEKKTETGVVIDFSTFPKFIKDGDVSLFILYKGIASEPTIYKGYMEREDMPEMYYQHLETSGIKAERDGSKVRVLGYTDKKGVFHPAIYGAVASKTIKGEELPRVINPPKE